MKPLPAMKSGSHRSAGDPMPALPTMGASHTGSISNANRRSNRAQVHRAYPWLLAASTGLAVVFCVLYVTKPVIVPPSSKSTVAAIPQPVSLTKNTPADSKGLMPGANSLPGDKTADTLVKTKPSQHSVSHPTPATPESPAFEETNLRIQHILTAEAPGGHLDRIDIDVPVLYQSRSLRWTPVEIQEARSLLARLMDYQEKARQLRSEGTQLLGSWNQLVGRSIPAIDLRADSPSLPANQEDLPGTVRHDALDSKHSIQLQHSEK